MTAPKITGGTITGSTINNSAIGGTTAAAGAFTTLSATGATTFSGATVVSGSLTANTFSSSGATITGGTINSTAIGGTTAAAGKFTTLEATGVTTVQAGTVSLPAITTSGETNTGIYFPAADTIGLTVGGVESARVVSGLLSIPANSTAPSAVRLYEDTDNGTNYVDLIASAAITSNRTLTIPDETGTIITTGSSGQSIPKAALPTGSVLQVVQAESATQTTVNSTSYTDSGLSCSITPTNSSSKILIIVNQIFTINRDSSDIGGKLQILRGSTAIKDYLQFIRLRATGASEVSNWGSYSFVYLDSPATTSSTTYKTQISATTTASNGQIIAQPSSAVSMITLLEIAA
jgi:hypothetical protein